MNVNSDIVNSTDERKVDFEWAISRISTTNCIAAFRLHTINFSHGITNTLTASFGQDHYGKCRNFVNMLTEKHMGFSYSYNNVRMSRKNFLKPRLQPNLKVIEERSSQSDLHCVFALTEADNANF